MIMKIYSFYGVNEFLICCGYKGYYIKEYFANYFLHMSDVTFDMCNNKMEVHRNHCEPWKVTLVDTGLHSMTGGRLKRVAPYLDNEPFCFTYGDGVADVDISAGIAFHKSLYYRQIYEQKLGAGPNRPACVSTAKKGSQAAI